LGWLLVAAGAAGVVSLPKGRADSQSQRHPRPTSGRVCMACAACAARAACVGCSFAQRDRGLNLLGSASSCAPTLIHHPPTHPLPVYTRPPSTPRHHRLPGHAARLNLHGTPPSGTRCCWSSIERPGARHVGSRPVGRGRRPPPRPPRPRRQPALRESPADNDPPHAPPASLTAPALPLVQAARAGRH
jgi:hypothetical protein